MTEEEAKKRVNQLKDFYGHLTAYGVVIPALAALNLFTSPGYLWFFFPMLGWSIGLLIHAANTFPLFGIGSKKWEEQKMKELTAQNAAVLNKATLQNMLQDINHNDVADPAIKKLIKRIEHLESVVKSKDWEKIPEIKNRIDAIENDPSSLSDEEIIARLAKRVR